MMSCGTWEPSVCTLLICLTRNETSVLEEEEKSVKGQFLREYCQGLRANNACILSRVTQTGSCTSKGWGRGKQSLWLIYLYWTKPGFWALWLFDWFSHDYRVLMKFILLIPFTKQTVYSLGQLGFPDCTFKCERRRRSVKLIWLGDSACHGWDKKDEVWFLF